MEQWEKHFNDWEKLLKKVNAEDLLKDPKAIWDEAWRTATIMAIGAVESKMPHGNLEEAVIALKGVLK